MRDRRFLCNAGFRKNVRMIESRQVPCNLCGSESLALLYPDELGDKADQGTGLHLSLIGLADALSIA